MLQLSSPSGPFPDVILFVTVAELVGFGNDPRLHRRLPEPEVTQRSEREPPLLRKGKGNSKFGCVVLPT